MSAELELARYEYRAALTELERTARAFALAVVDVAAKAAPLAGEPEDPLALRTLARCHAHLVRGFAAAPGMSQIFGGPPPAAPIVSPNAAAPPDEVH